MPDYYLIGTIFVILFDIITNRKISIRVYICHYVSGDNNNPRIDKITADKYDKDCCDRYHELVSFLKCLNKEGVNNLFKC